MKIFVLGDSISMQYGPHLERGLSGIMEYSRKQGRQEGLKDLDQAQGANGGDSARVLSYLEACAAGEGIDADLLLLNCGLHDIKTDPVSGDKQVPLEHYIGNLEKIVSIVRSLKPELIWIRTTPCHESIHNKAGMGFYRYAADCRAYNAAADAIMRKHAIPVIDLHTFTANLGTDAFCDHVHFHEYVCEQQAAFIAGWLEAHCLRPDIRYPPVDR